MESRFRGGSSGRRSIGSNADFELVRDVSFQRELRVSPDSRRLAAHFGGSENDIWIYAFERGTMRRLTLEPGEDESDARPLLDSRFDERLARISPDGRYIAYMSNESGREEVYVQCFPDLGDKHQISNRGGVQPDRAP
ncbi:MAG: hypothetical protein E2P02_11645 [Acidobacteria bacterium]|nr:MAG: hypothetical protein E2P02_11645 [Acidobacteriota bacterium]